MSTQQTDTLPHISTEKEVATYLRCTTAALRRWRRERRGPTWMKVGRLVRYRREDVIEYLNKTLQTSRYAGR